ncbi:MAG: class I SAM-dependent methyltransferase [Candidatus Thiodiazotropha sp. (ex Lucinoma borealis)]|nr:class I SAM-dependent methyltransferase [Candidatus Thiodiazotropha sp. (ex Lucinoma borealis)]MCU7865354.1 class I SAM-dependent methyltransferase [Candidatus Thiodiazotropha sp. (ex Lucinoma borealis)]
MKHNNYTTYVRYRPPQLDAWNVISKYTLSSKKSKILDVGCGPGVQTNLALSLFDGDYYGIDNSNQAIDMAYKSIATSRAHFICGDAQHLPFCNEAFNLVVYMLVLHQLEDVKNALFEARRVIGKNGKVAIVSVFEEERNKQIEFRYFPSLAKIEKLRHPKEKEITNFLQNAGFRVISKRAKYFRPPIDTSLVHAIKNRYFSSLNIISDAELFDGCLQIEEELKNPSILHHAPPYCTILIGY